MAARKRNLVIISAIAAAAVIAGGISYYFATNQSSTTSEGIPNPDSNNSAKNAAIEVLPANATVDSLTYGELTAQWWQSRLSIEEQKNPIADTTGEHCEEGQGGQVWWLDGTFGGLAERTCEIPKEKYILFPVMNSLCDYAEYADLKTESELRECARSANEGAELMVKINGVEVEKSKIQRVESPLFNLDLPDNNILGLPAQKTEAVADGFWVLLEPLPEGNHQIEFTGSVSDFTAGSTNNFVTSSKYQITVS